MLGILFAAALAGTILPLTFFPEGYVLLGSCAVLLVVRLYGTGWGLLAALLAGGCAFAVWQHPFLAFLMVTEVLIVGMLVRRGVQNIVVADGIFWALFGLPSLWIFYGVVLRAGGDLVLPALLRYGGNGLGNALLAALAFHLLIAPRWERRSPPLLWETHFNLLISAFLLPAILVVLLYTTASREATTPGETSQLAEKANAALPWVLAVEIPQKTHLAHLQRVVGGTLAIMLLPTLLAIGILPLLTRRLIRPLNRLVEVSDNLPERIRDGEEIHWPQGSAEIDALVGNLRTLAAALENGYREIETLKESSEEALDRVLTRQRWEDFSVSRKLQQEIGKRRRMEELLEHIEAAETKYRFLVEKTLVGVFIVQEDCFSYLNPRFAEIFGYTAEEILREGTVLSLIDQEDRAFVAGNLRRQLSGEARNLQYEFRGRRKDGSIVHVEALNGLGTYNGRNAILGTLIDITERKQAEEKVRHLAYHDPLTGLPNRLLFSDRAEQAMAMARRDKEVLGLLFIDLDRFKAVNDTLGHDIGDRLLCEVATRLRECVRESDTVSRFGGDEFNLLLTQVRSESDAELVAHKILRALRWPFTIQGYELNGTVSIGIALFPRDGNDVQTLIKNADTALYRAKDLGRNNYQIFRSAMNAQALERMELENSLRKVIDRQELRVYYQAQANLHTGKIIGMEALLRWQHASGEMISPATFIPLAEEMGLIFPIGEWIMRAACRQARDWQKSGFAPLRLGVNVSAQQFQDPEFLDILSRILKESQFEPQWLNVEITESVVINDVRETIQKLRQLHTVGITVAIDDFGVGYSSLSYLKDFPIDQLKMDRSFVQNLPHSGNDAKIARHIVDMAHSLGLSVIAEGVETAEQLQFLRTIGCDEVQGYLLSRPVPAEEFERLLQASVPLPLGGEAMLAEAAETAAVAPKNLSL